MKLLILLALMTVPVLAHLRPLYADVQQTQALWQSTLSNAAIVKWAKRLKLE